MPQGLRIRVGATVVGLSMEFSRDISPTVLVIRAGALGDTILTIPLLESLRAKHPQARVTFLGTRGYRPLLPDGVEFCAFDSEEWLWLFSTGAADPPRHARSFDLAYVILKRSETVAENLRRAGTRLVFSAPPTPRSGTHMVVHLHEALGLPVPEARPCLQHLSSRQRKDLIWVHPGSGGPGKCVPLSIFAEMTEVLKRLTGYRAAVTSGQEDAFLTESAKWEGFVHAEGTALFDRRPLSELCRELAPARIFLGNDSGISHLAAGLGIPAVVFFVNTDPQVWSPWTRTELLRTIDLRGREQESAVQEAVTAIQELLTQASRDSVDRTSSYRKK